jgi:hypothetical protein
LVIKSWRGSFHVMCVFGISTQCWQLALLWLQLQVFIKAKQSHCHCVVLFGRA